MFLRLTLAALAAFATTARATDLTWQLTGTVTEINPDGGHPEVEPALAAHGVVVGAHVAIVLVIDDTATGKPFSLGTQYDSGVANMEFTIGSWHAPMDPPAGSEDLANVQVADGSDFDSWIATTPGYDTDLILTSPDVWAHMTLVFQDDEGDASGDEGMVQDLAAYGGTLIGHMSGPDGQVVFSLDAPGGGTGPTLDPAALARKGQLKAAAKMGKSVLKGLGKLTAAGPDADPFGAGKEALLQDASDLFGTQCLAAIDKALKKGGTAPLGADSKQDATDYLMDGLLSQSDAITGDGDPSDALDNALRGKLLKALGGTCRADFLAHAKDVMKPDPVKLAFKLEKSHAKFVKKAEAAMDKALAQGLVYVGPGAEAIANDLMPFVSGFVDLTGTGF